MTVRKVVPMSGAQLYDTIGADYTVTRRTEPRIAAQIWAALGDARTVLNVGAGRRRTWRRASVAGCRSGPESGRTPSGARCTASARTSRPVTGPNATGTSSISTRQISASAC